MADEILIDWQVQHGIINKQLGYILKTGLHADCEFIVGGDEVNKTFKAHKLILISASPVFESMVLGVSAEQKSLGIPDIEPEVFEKILEFIYTGQTTFQSVDEACLIYCSANKYILKELMEQCVQYCLKNLNDINIFKCHTFALTFSISLLQSACLDVSTLKIVQWICININQIINNNSFKDADYSAVDYILNKDYLNIGSELQLFKMIEQYVEGISGKIFNASSSELENIEKHYKRSPEIDRLIKKVRFLCMSAKEFTNGTYNSNLLIEYEKYAILMNILLDNPPEMPEGFNETKLSRKSCQR